VEDEPVLDVFATEFNETAEAGQDTFYIKNTGFDVLTWTVSTNTSWIDSFSIVAGTQDTMVVFYYQENTGIEREGTITVEAEAPALNTPTHITVTQEGSDLVPELEVIPLEFAFNNAVNSDTSFISNVGNGDLNWTVSTNASWITINSNLSGLNNDTILFSVLNNTTSQSRVDSIKVEAQGAHNSPQYIVITQNYCDLSIDTAITNTMCALSTGSIAVTPQGGTAPYSYLWSNNATDSLISNLGGGKYDVTVTDQTGCELEASITVVNEDGPVADFDFSIDHMTVDFTDQSTFSAGSISSRLWKYGDGNLSTNENPTYTYSAEDSYEVCLEVTSNTSCKSEVCKNVEIIDTTKPVLLVTPIKFVLGNTASEDSSFITNGGIQDLNWSLSTNASWISINSSLTGINDATVIFSVTENNSGQGRIDSIKVEAPSVENSPIYIVITQANCDITMDTIITHSMCDLSTGAISVSPQGGDAPYSYSWSNDSTKSSVSNLAAGTYTVTITDQVGCVLEASLDVNNADGPVADFDFVVNGMSVDFTDESTTNGSAITSRLWNFDNGNLSTNETPSNTYNTDGTYNVCLEVTSNDGCKSEKCKEVLIETEIGVNELSGENVIKIYPNPNSGTFNIQLNSISSDDVSIKLFNSLGAIVYNQSIYVNGEFIQEVNLNSLSAGVYQLSVSTSNESVTKKVLITK